MNIFVYGTNLKSIAKCSAKLPPSRKGIEILDPSPERRHLNDAKNSCRFTNNAIFIADLKQLPVDWLAMELYWFIKNKVLLWIADYPQTITCSEEENQKYLLSILQDLDTCQEDFTQASASISVNFCQPPEILA